MGQAATKERHGSDDPSGSSSSSSKHAKSYPASVDGGALVPQGVYQGVQDYDHDVVKTAIVQRRLMPFYKGEDDEETYRGRPFNTECPICFLYYPSPLNQTRCCAQPVCSECFVQMKRPDPTLHNPPTTHSPECPYCTAENFGIVYTRPSLSPATESADPSAASPSSNDRPLVSHGKRKSFSHTDREVLTVDAVRPDWKQKFAAAEQAVERRANRRLIMRQVGDRLIPIGVSSARAGAALPMGSGPAGAIVLRPGERWGNFSGDDNGSSSGSSRRRSRRAGNGLVELGMSGEDVEEMMLEEAMRLSLLEHEEQQRRLQNAGSSSAAPQGTASATDSAAVASSNTASSTTQEAATSGAIGVARSSSTSRGQPLPGSTRRADRLSQELRNAPTAAGETSISAIGSGLGDSIAQPAPRTSSTVLDAPGSSSTPVISARESSDQSASPPTTVPAPAPSVNFGLRDDMLTDLAELIDNPSDEMRQRLEAARRSREAAAVDAQQQQDRNVVAGTGGGTTSKPVSPPGSPSGGSTRALNPNNPFRSRLASGQSSAAPTPPSHSRVPSGAFAPSLSAGPQPQQEQPQ